MFIDNRTRGVATRTGTFYEREHLVLIGSGELEQRGAKVLANWHGFYQCQPSNVLPKTNHRILS